MSETHNQSSADLDNYFLEHKKFFSNQKTREEEILLMRKNIHIENDDKVLISKENYILVYNYMFEKLVLKEFDFKNGLFKDCFYTGNLSEENLNTLRGTYFEFEKIDDIEKINMFLHMKKDYDNINFGWMPMIW